MKEGREQHNKNIRHLYVKGKLEGVKIEMNENWVAVGHMMVGVYFSPIIVIEE